MKKQKFPGFENCMRMMRKSDPQIQEDGFNWLARHVKEHVDQLIDTFNIEKDIGIKCWLLELIGKSKSPKSFQVLKDSLNHENASVVNWAVWGLQNLDTKEARRELHNRK